MQIVVLARATSACYPLELNQRQCDIHASSSLTHCRRFVGISNMANLPASAVGNARRATVAKVSKKPVAKPSLKKAKAAAAPALTAHEDDDVCGCDVVITEADATADADLPPARGGVAVARAKRR